MSKSATAVKKDIEENPLFATPAGSEMDIPCSLIVADDEFNARKNIDGENDEGHSIKTLARSIEMDGQISPVLVAVTKEYPGKFFLISGYRRFYAISRKKENGGLNQLKIRATVYNPLDKKGNPVPVDLKDLKYLNLIENEARKALNPYERSLRYHDLVKNHEEKGAAIARRVSLDPSYVNRLIAAMEMHPRLVARFKEEWDSSFTGTRLLTTDVINKLTHMRIRDKEGNATDRQDHESQLKWLESVLSPKPETSDEEGDGDDAESTESDKVSDKRASLAQVNKAITAAEAALKEASNKEERTRIEGVIDGLKFALKPRKIEGVLTVSKDGKKIKGADGKEIAAPKQH